MLSACVADAGGRPVIVGGRQERRVLATEFGAEPGDGRGADIVVEAAGTEQAWSDAVELVRPGGTVVHVRRSAARCAASGRRVPPALRRADLRGSFHHTPATVRAALAFLASGAYPWERLVTHRVPLAELPALFADPPRDLLKAAVVP